MIPNPIRKVLSSMRTHRVRALLMGGQACVFYGAAEFSRDTDFAILAVAANLARLRRALDALQAEVIAVPPFVTGKMQSKTRCPVMSGRMGSSFFLWGRGIRTGQTCIMVR